MKNQRENIKSKWPLKISLCPFIFEISNGHRSKNENNSVTYPYGKKSMSELLKCKLCNNGREWLNSIMYVVGARLSR